MEIPTQTVLLTVNEEEQLRRLGLRNEKSRTASDSFCLNETLRRRVHESYQLIAKRESWIIVDTNQKEIGSVFDEVLQKTAGGVLV